MAAFHSMVHRLCKLPLSVANYKKEYEHILNVAKVNGYKPCEIDRLIKKHSKKVMKDNLSSLFRQNKKCDNENALKRVPIVYAPEITNKLKQCFKQHNMAIVCASNNKLKSLLGSTKDKVDKLQKTGIYEVSCDDCEQKYIGQTSRNLKVRFGEHMSHVKYNRPQKSSVAEHILSNAHFNVSINNLKLIKSVNKLEKLDAYESYHIHKCTNSMNNDEGNIVSPLFCLL